jgi:hypothetical protein
VNVGMKLRIDETQWAVRAIKGVVCRRGAGWGMECALEGKANLGGWNLKSVPEVPGCDGGAGVSAVVMCFSGGGGKRQAEPGVPRGWVSDAAVDANSGLAVLPLFFSGCSPRAIRR